MQVCADGKTLLDTLQTPVSTGSNNSLTAKADYSEAAAHVLDVVHEVRAEIILSDLCLNLIVLFTMNVT